MTESKFCCKQWTEKYEYIVITLQEDFFLANFDFAMFKLYSCRILDISKPVNGCLY